MSRRRARTGRAAVIGLPYFWLVVFFLVPFAIVLAISFAESTVGIPPYALALQIGNYATLFGDALYLKAYLNSVVFAGVATLACLLLGYPMAYAIARAPGGWRNPLLLLVILPFWTSFLIRVYAWIGILSPNGLANQLLERLGLIAAPLPLLNNAFSVILGLAYSYLPFMVLPHYATLERQDPALLEAAADLGAPPWRRFLWVTLPLSLPGIVAGCLLVFIPAVGEFVIPDLLGGPDTLMIGKVLWDEFFANRDWPVASALAVMLLIVLLVPILFYERVQRRAIEGEV